MRTNHTFEFDGQIYEISAYYMQTVRGPWNDGSNMLHNKFMCFFGSGEKKKFFVYYGSFNDYKKGVKQLDENGLMTALYCFVSDAMSGAGTYADFIGEFGETAGSYKTYKACKESYNKLSDIFGGWKHDIYSLFEFICENWNI